MSAAKHTPGPWKLDKNYQEVIGSNKDVVLLRYFSLSSGTLSKCLREEVEANALLAIAAPDLLEALEIVAACRGPEPVTFYKEDGWRWTHPDGSTWEVPGAWDEPPPMHPVARAALAKARGEA